MTGEKKDQVETTDDDLIAAALAGLLVHILAIPEFKETHVKLSAWKLHKTMDGS